MQVMTAQQAMPQLQQQASDAAARLQPAQAEERQQGQCFAQQAPKLLQVAATLLQPVQDCQVAAQEVLPGLDAMQAALKDVLGQIEVCTRAVGFCSQPVCPVRHTEQFFRTRRSHAASSLHNQTLFPSFSCLDSKNSIAQQSLAE